MRCFLEKLIIGFAWICGILLLFVVGSMVAYLLYRGAGSINPALIFGDTKPLDALLLKEQVFDGLFPAISGTLILVVLSVGMAVPMGVAAGIYMAEYAGRRSREIFGFVFDILSGIPSIVIGLFGFSVAVFLHQHFLESIYPCLLISALSLAFLVLPYLIRTTQTAIEGIPEGIRKTAPALGATRLQNIIHVLIPHSLSGIVGGVVLSIGRCAEDTAVIMLTGVVASAGVPTSIFSNYEALPFYIYYISSQYTDAQELSKGFGAAVILLLICTVLFSLAFFIKGRIKTRMLVNP